MLWREDLLRVNPDAKVTVETIGAGKHKVVLVDDFYQHGEEVMQLAHGLYYFSGPMHGNFPGGRAMVSLDTRPQLAALSESWGSKLEPQGQQVMPVIFSAIVSRDQQLNIAQRSPHFDAGVTAMVYLNPTEQCTGGTGIYRHKLTGLERLPIQIDQTLLQFAAKHGYTDPIRNEAEYTRFQDAMIFNPLFAAPENEYINGGNDYWELLYLIEMKFNRMVIFDGRMPHSQHFREEDFRDYPRVNQILYLAGEDPR